MVISAIKSPGVYVNEVSIFPPSVAQVPTAIPAFIGYTEKAEKTNSETLLRTPWKIGSMLEFELYFGKGPKVVFDATTGSGVELDANNQVVKADNKQDYFLYGSLQLYFANGGGECYIISVGRYTDTITFGTNTTGMLGGLDALSEVDEPTMIVFPDAVSLFPISDFYKLQQVALKQCGALMDRVAVLDIVKADDKITLRDKIREFRDSIGMSDLKYGAVYAPWLKVGIKKDVRYRDLKGQIVKAGTTVKIKLDTLVKNLSAFDTTEIKDIITALDEITSDNNFIEKAIKDSLKATNNASIRPAGFSSTDNLPSLESAFDLAFQSVNTLAIEAQIMPDGTAKRDKIDDEVAPELFKLLQQLINIIGFIDSFSYYNPATAISNIEVIVNMYKSLEIDSALPSPMPAPPNPGAPIAIPAGTFNSKFKEVQDWFVTLTTTRAIAQDFGSLATLITYYTPKTYVLPVGASNPVLLASGSIPAAGNANDNTRIDNLIDTASKFRVLFKYFHDRVNSIQIYGQTVEKLKEDSLLKMWSVYKGIVDSVNNSLTVLPPSGAMAGIYARVDNERGVWKAPANVSVTYATGTLVNITDAVQDGMNVDVDAGKSVNAIRSFSGKGVMVWGARTLAGNDNEWRYISVRRFFNMVEESVKKSTYWAVFEPNDANTWLKVKSMIENFLTLQWRQGALAGAKPEEAFFVEVGLNKTMTFVDVLEGRMIVKIGMAAVRPAEFIILEFSHKIQTS